MTDEIRVGMVGVGNCASALVQGVSYYAKHDDAPGLMTDLIGGRAPADIRFTSAFDVSAAKVGLDLSAAITAEPNCTADIAEVPYQDVTVVAGPRLDGVGEVAADRLRLTDAVGDVAEHLRATRTEVLVNYLPVGSEEATRFYAACAVEAGCALVNAIPAKIARDPAWHREFAEAGLPLIGDDIKSQVGATIVHRVLAQLFSDRGIHLDRTYQLNVGGNMDFYNMLERGRLTSKRESKTSAVTDVANRGEGMAEGSVHIGPSDFVPWLEDRKLAFIRLEGSAFGGVPLSIELKMDVWDSPNSAGVIIDAVRYAKLALDRGLSGTIDPVCAWLMKAPPTPMTDDDALRACRDFNLPLADD